MTFQDHWDHWEQRKSVKTKAFAKAHPKKMPLNIYIYTNNNNNPENRPKEISLHHFTLTHQKKKQLTEASQSRKVNLEQAGCRRSGPRRGHWRRGAGEVPQGGVGGFNDPKRLIQPIENGDLTH